MIHRQYVRSGVIEEVDQRQQQLLELTLAAIEHYYRNLYQTEKRFEYPLSLSILMQLTNRSGSSVLGAIRILANSTAPGESTPPIFYDRISTRHRHHRPYRIYLRTRPNEETTSRSGERSPQS